jgi:neutral amino acid transport system substrate-binding protein
MSPSLSLKSECVLLDGYAFGKVSCHTDNAKHFIRHFTERWEGAQPFPAAHLYYDAVVLLALALNYAAATREGDAPNAKQLHRLIRDLSQPENAPAYWHDLPAAVQRLEKGQKSRYVGAGAEYEFDDFGVAQHVVFDTWTIRNHEFSDTGGYYAKCFVQQ